MKRLALNALTVLVFLCIMASVAFADSGDNPNSAQRVADIAFDFLSVIVLALGGYLAARLAKFFEKKTGIDIPAKQEEQINAWVRQGILWAEEKSRNKIKEKAAKLKGSEKLEFAAKFVLDMAQAQGWVNWSKDKIEAKIESWLGEARANGGKPRLDAESSPDLPVS